MNKKLCSQLFSQTIKTNMRKMGSEKSRPQVIAISAKDTIRSHPKCKKYLDRPQEKISLSDKHWIYWFSKSFRIYHDKPSCIRVFFYRRVQPTHLWKQELRRVLKEKLGLTTLDVPKQTITSETNSNNYFEIPLQNPKTILTILNKRVANFLD